VKTRYTTAAVAIGIIGLAGSVLSHSSPFHISQASAGHTAASTLAVPSASTTASATPSAAPSPSASATIPPVSDFISPSSGKYLGISLVNGENGLAGYDATTGTPADLQEEFLHFGEPPPLTHILDAYDQHALTVLSWQPVNASMASIIAGKQDSYITAFADELAQTSIPVGIVFAPEFNGNWESWGAGGPDGTTPAQYVAAWRRVHDLFVAAGVTNVIWIWAPNVINPVRKVDISQYWPGSQYVNWIGMSAYWTGNLGEDSWPTLIEPTEQKVEAFTNDPIVITETGAEQGAEKITWIGDMLAGLATDPHVLGMIYLNSGTAQGKRADWTFTDNGPDLAAWKAGAAKIKTVQVNN
jgi:mannan endo-1,4-beta-mannosidase